MAGTVALGIGLWRARSVPRWVAVLLASIVATLFLPTNGVVGLISELPHTLGAMAVAECLWRAGPWTRLSWPSR